MAVRDYLYPPIHMLHKGFKMLRGGFLFILFISTHNVAASDLPRIFMTSVKGTGDLSSWPDAHGHTGLRAADEICRARASAASIQNPERYIALMSDSASDAYCRMHGRPGRVYTNQCGSASLPTGAGPWYRMDGLPAVDVAENSMLFYPEAGYIPRHILFDEFGAALPSMPTTETLAFTATMSNGVLVNPNYTCGDWTSTVGDVDLGSAYRGAELTWGFGSSCDREFRLICLEKGEGGTPLQRPRPSSARVAFVTSSTGTGVFSTWPDAGGKTSVDAADAVCQKHAERAGLPLPETFKAWLSTYMVDAIDRFENDGPFYRLDNALISNSSAQLASGVLQSPLQLDEFAHPVPVSAAWTGTLEDGRGSGWNCGDWMDDETGADDGRINAADFFWTTPGPYSIAACGNPGLRLYCFGDNDSIFLNGLD